MQHLPSPSSDQTQAPLQYWCGILTTVLPRTNFLKLKKKKKGVEEGFPCGPAVKNQPYNARDAASIHGQ